jgi:hypothetical protein
MERANGFEPSTLTLARLCSTPELRPHSKSGGLWRRAAPDCKHLDGTALRNCCAHGRDGEILESGDFSGATVAKAPRVVESGNDTGTLLLSPTLGVMALTLAAPLALLFLYSLTRTTGPVLEGGATLP